MVPGFGLERADESRRWQHGGDLLSDLIQVGLAAVGMTVGAIAQAAAPMAVAWALLGPRLGGTKLSEKAVVGLLLWLNGLLVGQNGHWTLAA